MRAAPVHSTLVQFRANPHLVEAGRAKAIRQGMSFAELMRAALRRELESGPTLAGDNPAPATTSAPSPLAVAPNDALGPIAAKEIEKAAKGDLAAQRVLFSACLDAVTSPAEHPLNAQYVAMELMVIGRLVAAHGLPEDIRRLAAALVGGANVLRRAGRPDIADHMVAEAISVLEQMADCGDDLAASCSEALIRRESPEVAAKAKTMRRNAVEEAI